MTKKQIQSLIENLRTQSAANSISPDMLATILTYLNNAEAEEAVEIESLPHLYCEVVKGKLYVRNFEYYAALGYVPILFRYIRKRNRYRLKKGINYSPYKKGWFANGVQGTLRVSDDGLVARCEIVVNSPKTTPEHYLQTARTFIMSDARKTEDKITWGNCQISMQDCKKKHMRMVRLPFAIGYAQPNTDCSKAITVGNIVSNLAPFFVRGQVKGLEYIWSFSK